MRGFMIFVLLVVVLPVITTFVLKRRWGLPGPLQQYPLTTRMKVAYSAMLWPITLPVLFLTNQQAARRETGKRDELDAFLSQPGSSDAPAPDIPFGSTPPTSKPKNPFDD